MRTYFDKELLQQSSIFELRNIARDIGVYSPTIYKKEELIEKIFQIVNGEVKPYIPKSKQGRPPKSLSTPSRKSVFDMILPTDEVEYTIEESSMPCLSESVREFLEDDKVRTKTNFDIEGTLEITKYGYGFVRQTGKQYSAFSGAYVSINMLKQNCLKNGDYITGKAKLLEDDKPLVMYEIISINNGQRSYGDFENLEVVYAQTKLNLNCEIDNFVVGGTNLIIYDKENNKSAYDYINKLSKSNKTIFVKIEANKEQELLLSEIQSEKYYTTMIQKPAEHISVLNLALSRAKNIATQNEDVVLYIDSIDKVMKNQNSVNGNNLLDIKANTFDIIKILSMSARQFAQKGSITVVGLYNYKNGNSFDIQSTAELEDYFTNIYITKKQD